MNDKQKLIVVITTSVFGAALLVYTVSRIIPRFMPRMMSSMFKNMRCNPQDFIGTPLEA